MLIGNQQKRKHIPSAFSISNDLTSFLKPGKMFQTYLPKFCDAIIWKYKFFGWQRLNTCRFQSVKSQKKTMRNNHAPSKSKDFRSIWGFTSLVLTIALFLKQISTFFWFLEVVILIAVSPIAFYVTWMQIYLCQPQLGVFGCRGPAVWPFFWMFLVGKV